jgi:hypothetical protein
MVDLEALAVLVHQETLETQAAPLHLAGQACLAQFLLVAVVAAEVAVPDTITTLQQLAAVPVVPAAVAEATAVQAEATLVICR